MRARIFIILIQFFMISLLAATESTIQIQGLEEVLPGIYQKLKKENRLSGFHLAQFTPGRDKAAILFRDKIEIVNSTGNVLVACHFAAYGLSQPSEHYSWNAEGTQFVCSVRSAKGQLSLYLLDMTGNLTELVPAPEFRGQVLQPEWSFDGKFLAYVKSALGPEPKSSVYILNVNTGEEKQIGHHLSGNAKWMNRSNRLFYENAIPPFNTPQRPLRELYCFDAGDHSNTRFVNESFSQISVAFPADDSFLVINSDQALFTFDRSGHQIRKFDLNAVNPQVSPDGKTAACIDFEDDGHRIIRQSIQILDLETGSIESILIDTAHSLQSIIWLDNRRILYH